MDTQDNLQYFNQDLNLWIPNLEQIKISYDQELINQPATPFPFWAKLWPASITLTDFLQSNTQWIENKKVLEIGAGIGLPSFSIATLAKEVIISDHAADAIALMNKNINHLQLTNTSAICLDWNDFPTEMNADTILLSDVNYAPEQFEPLQNLIQRFIAEGSTILLATPQRIMGVPFIKSLQNYILEKHVYSIREHEQPIDISVMVLQK